MLLFLKIRNRLLILVHSKFLLSECLLVVVQNTCKLLLFLFYIIDVLQIILKKLFHKDKIDG